jgi:hypothetical protein
MSAIPPFSARNRGAQPQIDNDFPESARIGLIHLIDRLVSKRYVEDWQAINGELKRIARVLPGMKMNADELLLLQLSWEKVCDFCERLHSHLASDFYIQTPADEFELASSRSDAQAYITTELQQLFLEENLAFEFSDGVVRRRGRRNTADQISRAGLTLGDPRLGKAREHYNKALRYFRNVAQPDYENVFKEAVCAVEATARALFPSDGSRLGEVVKSIAAAGKLPKAIAQTFHGLYGFRSSGDGVGHGGAEGGSATKELAEYALAVAASQIVLLVDVAAAEDDVPF